VELHLDILHRFDTLTPVTLSDIPGNLAQLGPIVVGNLAPYLKAPPPKCPEIGMS